MNMFLMHKDQLTSNTVKIHTRKADYAIENLNK